MKSTEHFMRRALQLAEQGRYCASPNPMVGCVIVKANKVIGEGWHQGPGTNHAEIMALKQAGDMAKGADVYVTLEPCCHYGRTPPCADALIEAGVKRVVVAVCDLNPLVNGKGMRALQEAGITVRVGIGQLQAEQLNQRFFHFMQQRRPFVIAKWAMSLDGKMQVTETDSRQISNDKSRQHTHLSRCEADAILIGVNTAISDNPKLTTRLPAELGIPNRQPLRIILDSRGRAPLDLHLFDSRLPGQTLVVTTQQSQSVWREQLQSQGVALSILPADQHGRIHLQSLMTDLYERHISCLLVEGGMTILEQFFAAGLVDEVRAYLAPVVIGKLPRKLTFQCQEQQHLDDNYFWRGTPCTQA